MSAVQKNDDGSLPNGRRNVKKSLYGISTTQCVSIIGQERTANSQWSQHGRHGKSGFVWFPDTRNPKTLQKLLHAASARIWRRERRRTRWYDDDRWTESTSKNGQCVKAKTPDSIKQNIKQEPTSPSIDVTLPPEEYIEQAYETHVSRKNKKAIPGSANWYLTPLKTNKRWKQQANIKGQLLQIIKRASGWEDWEPQRKKVKKKLSYSTVKKLKAHKTNYLWNRIKGADGKTILIVFRMPKQRKQGRKRLQRGWGGINLVGALQKLNPPEMHWLSYQFLGTFTKLEKRLKRGDKGINRLDCIAKTHDIDYSKAKSKEDIWKADEKMVKAIGSLRKKL